MVTVMNLLKFEEIDEVILLLAAMIWCKQDQCIQGVFSMGQRLQGGYIED